jgi:hypothetical protein
MSGRAERRRQQRAHNKGRLLVLGDNVVATELGHRYEAQPRAQLPTKVPGEHRWIVAATWAAPKAMVETAFDPDQLKLMDNENLLALSIGCWDCEQPLGAIEARSRCPAGDEWTKG